MSSFYGWHIKILKDCINRSHHRASKPQSKCLNLNLCDFNKTLIVSVTPFCLLQNCKLPSPVFKQKY